MRAEIGRVIALQEEIGLDVLVHGEPERNDMVQYFAEHLDGYAATANGWVQSYGTRYVRPPILLRRRQPARSRSPSSWASYAQSLTAKPVKGMLTGPVTMLAWSFVRDDQPLADTARQVALAVRDEIADLRGGRDHHHPGRRARAAGAAAVAAGQTTRPTWTGRWRRSGWRPPGSADATQIHTHLCYTRVRRDHRCHRRARRGRDHHRGGPLPDGVLDDLTAAGFAQRASAPASRTSTHPGCRRSRRWPNR